MTEANRSGARIGGRYELGELLGRGGMAEVRLATDIRLGRTVAVKRLRTDLAADPTFQARFRREAQAAASLNHPNIVSVYDTGEEMAPDGSHVQPYIVMEYVPGRTLREVLNDGRKLLPERALELTAGVLSALEYSHRARIIHRDIKPANVMLTPSGDVKVMDFGIARAISETTSTMTQTAAVVGTAQYLSPEQARGEVVDSRSDIYSTGCLLYELLVGRPPFVGDSPFSVAYQHVREQPEPPSAYNSDIDPALDAIVMKSLAKKVEERYQSAAEMDSDIRRYLDGQPVAAPATLVAPVVSAPDPQPTSLFGDRSPEEDTATQEEESRRRWPLVLLVLAVVAVLAGAVWAGLTLFDPGTRTVTVPDVTQMTVKAADNRLTSAGLQLGSVRRVNSDKVEKGRVISQDPAAQGTVDEGTDVNLTVSAGSEMVTVPFILGDTKAEAEDKLSGAGLNAKFETRDSAEPRGQVLETNPTAAATVAAGSTVQVVLSSGPVAVPNVVGRTESEATQALDRAGLEVNTVTDSTTPAERGSVLSQDPAGGTDVAPGATVTIVVSDYEEPTPTPTPTPTETPTPTPTETETPTPTETPSPSTTTPPTVETSPPATTTPSPSAPSEED